VVSRVVADGTFAGRIWTYLTDIPQSVAEMTEEKAAATGRDRGSIPVPALPD